jgi:protein-tyrosine phosphatase
VRDDRTLVWDGCLNVRDLGGHPTEDGGETRFGRVVRADSVSELRDEGWEALVEYGIKTIVDLRLNSELEADPPRELAVEVHHIPLVPEFEGPEADVEFWEHVDRIRLEGGGRAAATRDVYLEFLEHFGANFARAVSAVAQAPPGGVVVHCQSGKDRTGLVAALLLRLAGVSAAEIGADYALSAEILAAQLDEWVARAADERERAIRLAVSATPGDAMESVVLELERRYGGVAEYLLEAGATDDDLAQARARLRE